MHVWRLRLDRPADQVAMLRALLPLDERRRADRFVAERHRVRFTAAHGQLRRILAAYLRREALSLHFAIGEHGKPSLVAEPGDPPLAFNLSHSADLALLAVTDGAPVGVDVERHDDEVEHLELSERFFSPAERAVLHGLAPDARAVSDAFFAAWTRKEAYLKATGIGITRGLHHFDVSCAPGSDAHLLADRLDPQATVRWAMRRLAPGDGYSGALAAEAPLADVVLLDAA